MKDKDRKLLTEFLGECWHEWRMVDDRFPAKLYKCDKCDDLTHNRRNRTFTTPDDMMAVKEKLVEKDEWNEFIKFCWTEHHGHGKYCYSSNREFVRQVFTDWLINPARFAELVVGFMKRE